MKIKETVGRRRSQLLEEAKIYKLFQGCEGIPKLYHTSTEGGYHGVVMELLGSNIDVLIGTCGGHLSLATVLALADQMLDRIEVFHSKGFIHRDVKPENFTVGKNECSSTVYVIDYGLAKRYRNPSTKIHIPYKQGKKLTGTARYSSVSTHMGVEQSRRDDIECLGYTFIYMAKGELPWQGIKAETKKEKYEKIAEYKHSVPIEVLCKGLPPEFNNYMYYSRNLQFEDKPDYSQLKKLFRDCFYKAKYDKGFVFDWVKLGIAPDSYKKPQNTLGVAGNAGSSNKAENENAEDQILRARSKEIKRNNFDAANEEDDQIMRARSKQVSKVDLMEEQKKPMHLAVQEEPVDKKKLSAAKSLKTPGEDTSPCVSPLPSGKSSEVLLSTKFQQEGGPFDPAKEEEKRLREKEIKKLAEGIPRNGHKAAKNHEDSAKRSKKEGDKEETSKHHGSIEKEDAAKQSEEAGKPTKKASKQKEEYEKKEESSRNVEEPSKPKRRASKQPPESSEKKDDKQAVEPQKHLDDPVKPTRKVSKRQEASEKKDEKLVSQIHLDEPTKPTRKISKNQEGSAEKAEGSKQSIISKDESVKISKRSSKHQGGSDRKEEGSKPHEEPGTITKKGSKIKEESAKKEEHAKESVSTSAKKEEKAEDIKQQKESSTKSLKKEEKEAKPKAKEESVKGAKQKAKEASVKGIRSDEDVRASKADEIIRTMPPQVFRQISKELSENSSCNFTLKEILENHTIFGMLLLSVVSNSHNQQLDDSIPSEHPINLIILVPSLYKYIENEKHWQKFKARDANGMPVKMQTGIKKSALAVPGDETRAIGVSLSFKLPNVNIK